MAIKIVSGVLGAGKTYYCVSELLKKYYTYDDILDEWMPKKKESLVIVTNIDYLKLPCVPLDAAITCAGGLVNYFRVDFHNAENDKQKIIIIDEAQKYFDRKFYDKSVFEFFQYSRHLGIDIYLITQDVGSLAKELQNIAEYEVQTVRRSFQVGVEFRYHLVANGEKIKTKVLRKDPRVFAVYRSHQSKEAEKISSVPVRFFIFFLFAAGLAVFGYFFLFHGGHLFGSSSKVSSDRNRMIKTQTQIQPQTFSVNPKQLMSSVKTLPPAPPPFQPSVALKLPECNAYGASCVKHVGYIEYQVEGEKGLKQKVHIYQQGAPQGELSGEHSGAGAQLPPSPLEQAKKVEEQTNPVYIVREREYK